MTDEVTYDDAATADVIQGQARAPGLAGGDGTGCHAGAAEMEAAGYEHYEISNFALNADKIFPFRLLKRL